MQDTTSASELKCFQDSADAMGFLLAYGAKRNMVPTHILFHDESRCVCNVPGLPQRERVLIHTMAHANLALP